MAKLCLVCEIATADTVITPCKHKMCAECRFNWRKQAIIKVPAGAANPLPSTTPPHADTLATVAVLPWQESCLGTACPFCRNVIEAGFVLFCFVGCCRTTSA